jgi:hypothetical protein
VKFSIPTRRIRLTMLHLLTLTAKPKLVFTPPEVKLLERLPLDDPPARGEAVRYALG